METITIYTAIDGSQHFSENACINYERLINTVNRIMSRLPPEPEDVGSKFANGRGFIQHDKTTLRKVKNNLLEEIKKRINHLRPARFLR